jgi:hypothetical protein
LLFESALMLSPFFISYLIAWERNVPDLFSRLVEGFKNEGFYVSPNSSVHRTESSLVQALARILLFYSCSL